MRLRWSVGTERTSVRNILALVRFQEYCSLLCDNEYRVATAQVVGNSRLADIQGRVAKEILTCLNGFTRDQGGFRPLLFRPELPVDLLL